MNDVRDGTYDALWEKSFRQFQDPLKDHDGIYQSESESDDSLENLSKLIEHSYRLLPDEWH